MTDQLGTVVGRAVPRETELRLKEFEDLLREESQHQNLVSRGTLDDFWTRHVLDSAQLVRFAPSSAASWLDVGSGAGLPGIVIACLVEGPVTLVEPRRLRVEFLHKVVERLGISANVVCAKAERLEGRFDVITARAVARLDELLKISLHLSTRNSVWILPKGRNANSEVAEARSAWQGKFHVEPSVTDANSGIVVATDVRPKRS